MMVGFPIAEGSAWAATVALYRMDGLSQAEVGDLAGCSQSSISAALRR